MFIVYFRFFDLYMRQLRHMVKKGFVSETHVDGIIVERDVTTLLDKVMLREVQLLFRVVMARGMYPYSLIIFAADETSCG
jgi:predicted Rossmann-fold nucleotide-binding protein